MSREIGKANAILVLIGNGWMAPAPGQGKPRLFDQGDHVRGGGQIRAAGKGVHNAGVRGQRSHAGPRSPAR